ncbi:hypothetical protein [uncultured Cyclobacterium sp.]|uniref:hypothetical protein n=1 Tax=uncultured Cyclobacterium sp. TaxID=453820 RepID=UPI0030EE8F0B|tara:strand:+ start:1739 stop:2299 length:561 start_codon:yes stop_codon:yes gene_type:complete
MQLAIKFKFVLTTFLIFYVFNSFGQYHAGHIINNNGETLKCEIFLPNYLNGQLNYSALTKNITTKTETGIIRYKPTDIKIAEIQLENNDKVRFMSIPEDKKQFLQENEIGKLSYFTLHISNSGFAAPILRKDGKLTYLNVVNKKKRVENMIADFPKLREDWNNNKYDFTELQNVVKLYNQHFKEMK